MIFVVKFHINFYRILDIIRFTNGDTSQSHLYMK
nr:MAG TPA: hypothetical protein [Bacteriophage sp.]